MKNTSFRSLRALSGIGLLAFLLVPLQSNAASIVGTKHDLSAMTNSAGQVCISCHTPHNAQTAQLVPLWNHSSTATTFTLYSSVTAKSTPGQPTGYSKACLSCHDGTVALDSFGGKAPAGAGMISGAAKLGTDLSDDHPVSFTYDGALATANGGLVSPASTSHVDAAKTIPLFNGKLECSSCHDAHDNTHTNFLRKSNAGSALCLSCHNK